MTFPVIHGKVLIVARLLQSAVKCVRSFLTDISNFSKPYCYIMLMVMSYEEYYIRHMSQLDTGEYPESIHTTQIMENTLKSRYTLLTPRTPLWSVTHNGSDSCTQH